MLEQPDAIRCPKWPNLQAWQFHLNAAGWEFALEGFNPGKQLLRGIIDRPGQTQKIPFGAIRVISHAQNADGGKGRFWLLLNAETFNFHGDERERVNHPLSTSDSLRVVTSCQATRSARTARPIKAQKTRVLNQREERSFMGLEGQARHSERVGAAKGNNVKRSHGADFDDFAGNPANRNLLADLRRVFHGGSY